MSDKRFGEAMLSEAPRVWDNPDWKPVGPERISAMLNDRDQAIVYIIRLENALGVERARSARLERELSDREELVDD